MDGKTSEIRKTFNHEAGVDRKFSVSLKNKIVDARHV
jgi:hypothetical protein